MISTAQYFSLILFSIHSFHPNSCTSFIVVVQLLSHVFVTPWTACSMPGFPVLHISQSLPKLMTIESAVPSNHLISCHSLLSCLQSFPTSGSFQMSHLFTSGGQNIGVSASVLPVNIQGWFPLEFTDLHSLLSKRLSRIFSSTTI